RLQSGVRDAHVLEHVSAEPLEGAAFRVPLQPRRDGHRETPDRRADPARCPAQPPTDRLRRGLLWRGATPSSCSSGLRPDAGHGAAILSENAFGGSLEDSIRSTQIATFQLTNTAIYEKFPANQKSNRK